MPFWTSALNLFIKAAPHLVSVAEVLIDAFNDGSVISDEEFKRRAELLTTKLEVFCPGISSRVESLIQEDDLSGVSQVFRDTCQDLHRRVLLEVAPKLMREVLGGVVEVEASPELNSLIGHMIPSSQIFGTLPPPPMSIKEMKVTAEHEVIFSQGLDYLKSFLDPIRLDLMEWQTGLLVTHPVDQKFIGGLFIEFSGLTFTREPRPTIKQLENYIGTQIQGKTPAEIMGQEMSQYVTERYSIMEIFSKHLPDSKSYQRMIPLVRMFLREFCPSEYNRYFNSAMGYLPEQLASGSCFSSGSGSMIPNLIAVCEMARVGFSSCQANVPYFDDTFTPTVIHNLYNLGKTLGGE